MKKSLILIITILIILIITLTSIGFIYFNNNQSENPQGFKDCAKEQIWMEEGGINTCFGHEGEIDSDSIEFKSLGAGANGANILVEGQEELSLSSVNYDNSYDILYEGKKVGRAMVSVNIPREMSKDKENMLKQFYFNSLERSSADLHNSFKLSVSEYSRNVYYSEELHISEGTFFHFSWINSYPLGYIVEVELFIEDSKYLEMSHINDFIKTYLEKYPSSIDSSYPTLISF